MRIHARGGYLDGTCPVEVVVAQCEDQLLQLELRQVGLIHGHMEVRRLLASLCPSDWEKEEVELIPVVAGALDKITVN